MKKVLVPLADGFEEMEGVIIIDVLRRAGVEVTVAGLHSGEIVASRKTRHLADTVIDRVEAEAFDMIVLPGGAEGARNLERHEAVRTILAAMNGAGKPIAAICAAPNVLRNTGLIGGNDPFTMHPGSLGGGTGGVYESGRRVVRHNNITTSIGPGSAFEFALDLVEQLCGEETRKQVETPMMLPARREA